MSERNGRPAERMGSSNDLDELCDLNPKYDSDIVRQKRPRFRSLPMAAVSDMIGRSPSQQVRHAR